MERSKLPVLRAQAPNTTDLVLPSAKKYCPSKPGPLYSKDPNIAFSSAAPDLVVFKAGGNGKKAVLPKKTIPFSGGPVNRFRMETELKDKNHLLEAANTTLRSNLVSAQKTIKEMTGKEDAMKEELKELNQRLEKHMIILETRNIDPVSGETIVSAAEETCRIKDETKAFTESLLKELNLFNLTTKEQKALVQKVKAKWKEAEENRRLFLEEQQAFQTELEHFHVSLQETHKWLDL